MLNAMHLRTLSNEELVRIASHEVNDLTSSALEIELLSRLEQVIDTVEPAEELMALTTDYGIDNAQVRSLLESHPSSVSEMTDLLKALNDEDIHTVDQLKQLISFHKEFQALASDAGDVFERLSIFTTNAIKE